MYGEEGAEPLLDITALKVGGFEADPRNEELKATAGRFDKGQRNE